MLLNKKNAQGVAVLAAVMYGVNEGEQAAQLITEPYCNGREQGFALVNWKTSKKVAFSEARNSDSIVVYFGKDTDFSMQGNSPSENTYTINRTLFDCLKVEEAANFIIDHLFVP
jgi:hypothetical protein